MRPQGIFRAADGRIVLQDTQGGVSVSIVPDELPPWPSELPALDLDAPDGQITLGRLRDAIKPADVQVLCIAGVDLFVWSLALALENGALGLLCDTEVVYIRRRVVANVPFLHLWGRGFRAAVATYDPSKLRRSAIRGTVTLDPVEAS